MSSTDLKIVGNSELESNFPVEVNKDTENVSTEFSRKTVESLNKQVRLVDSENGLDLFCYIKCGEHETDTLKKCRGVVFNNDEIVMNGFPYTYEYTEDNYDVVVNKIKDVFNECSFYDAYEGSLIRMFYFKDKWYTSTNRKLDANRSKWSSKESFGFFFQKALESELSVNERLKNAIGDYTDTDDLLVRFQSLLDKNKKYMFLLLNNEQNRIVCSAPSRPTVFHVGTFIDNVLSMEEDIYLPYPTKHYFKNINEIFSYVADVDNTKIQGVIVFSPNNTQYKIFNMSYYDLYKVRGNEPSIKFRYLQVRMDKRYNNLIRYLYPEFSQVFDDYENIIYNIAKNIHKAYFSRFIKNEYIKVPPEEFQVIKTCHDWHIKDRGENKINLNKVINILNEQQPTQINKMIRRFYTEQKELENLKEQKPIVDGDFPELKRTQQQRYKPLMTRNVKKPQKVEESV